MPRRAHERLVVIEHVEARAEHGLHALAEANAVDDVGRGDEAARITRRGGAGQDVHGSGRGLDGIVERDHRRQADVEGEAIAEPRQLHAEERLVRDAEPAPGPRGL